MSDENENYVPAKLNIYVGGYGGQSFWLWKKDGLFYYDSSERGIEGQNVKELQIDESAWVDFYEELEALSFWSWKRTYDNPNVLDGTQWEIDIEINGRRKKCSGSNAYPGGDGPEYSEIFERFLEAIYKLRNIPF